MVSKTIKEQRNPWKKSVYIFTNKDREGNFWILEWRKDGRIIPKQKRLAKSKQEIWRTYVKGNEMVLFEGMPNAPHIKRTGRKVYRQEKTPHKMTWEEYNQYINDRFKMLGQKQKKLSTQTLTAREYFKSLGVKPGDMKINTQYIKRRGFQPTEVEFKTQSDSEKKRLYKLRKKIAKGGYNVRAVINKATGRVLHISAEESRGEKATIVVKDSRKGKFIERQQISPASDIFEQAYINLQKLAQQRKKRGRITKEIPVKKIQPLPRKTAKVVIMKRDSKKLNKIVVLKDSRGKEIYRRYFPPRYSRKDMKWAIEKIGQRKGYRIKW